MKIFHSFFLTTEVTKVFKESTEDTPLPKMAARLRFSRDHLSLDAVFGLPNIPEITDLNFHNPTYDHKKK